MESRTEILPNDRKVFYIDVGDLSPEKVKEYLEKIKAEIRATHS